VRFLADSLCSVKFFFGFLAKRMRFLWAGGAGTEGGTQESGPHEILNYGQAGRDDLFRIGFGSTGHLLQKLAQGSLAVTTGQQIRNVHVDIAGKWDALGGVKVFGSDGPAAVFGPKLVPKQVVPVELQALFQELPVVVEGLEQIFRGKDTLDLAS